MKKSIYTNKAPEAVGPYSQAVMANGIIYVSGQLPIDPSTGTISTEITDQTQQSLENIKQILLSCGSDMSKVLKCGIFLKNMNHFPEVNTIYAKFFEDPYPARVTVEVARLPKDVLIEIDVTALA